MKKILIVEDEDLVRTGLETLLKTEGYGVVTAAGGGGVLDLVRQEDPNLIILDVLLPEEDGFSVLRQLRHKGFDTPVILLTVRADEIDRVVGLEIGADDYVVKPFSKRELVARVGACLRRVHRNELLTGVSIGDIDIDLRRRRVTRAGELVRFTDKELDLLLTLVRHRGKCLSREKLLSDVWGYDQHATSRTVDTHIFTLRQKLEANPSDPEHILTVHREGYKFV